MKQSNKDRSKQKSLQQNNEVVITQQSIPEKECYFECNYVRIIIAIVIIAVILF